MLDIKITLYLTDILQKISTVDLPPGQEGKICTHEKQMHKVH